MNEIDWHEYERRKGRVKDIGLTSFEYEQAIKNIVASLERETDLPVRTCPNCGHNKFRYAGKAYICFGCQGHFSHSDLLEEKTV